MENIENVTEQTTATETSNRTEDTFKNAFKIFVVFCIASILLFLWKQWDTFTFSEHIQYDAFGTFGDFIGGFGGTVIALYSVYLLVRTLQNQIETNKSVKETNKSVIETNKKLVSQTELQIFDSRFSTLLDLYKDAIDSYADEDGVNGRSAFEKIVTEFRTKGFENNTEYKRRTIGAVSEYVQLYVENRQNFSVHFRMLYLLSKLTAEEKMHENYRVSYAKSIRGQLSEGELLILRYNCLSPLGVQMRIYVNKFNLIKHLPVMNLLEFTYWREILNNNDEYCSAIDQLVILLKKRMTDMLDKKDLQEDEYKISSRLLFIFQLNETHDLFRIFFKIQKKKKRGGAIPRPTEEHAFDCILDKEKSLFPKFFKEMFAEMFVCSNFGLFNGDDYNIITTRIQYESDTEMEIEIKIERNGKPLALADRQVQPS